MRRRRFVHIADKANMISNAEKGQMFSGDIAIATVVFLAALSLAFFMWNATNDRIETAETLRGMEKASSEALEQLIRSPGVPRYWTDSDVKVLGLANADRIINATKASYFINMMNSTNYADNQYLMGLGEYHFYMNVTNLTGRIVSLNNTELIAGKELAGETDSLSLFRTAILNDTIVRFNFVVWR